MDLKKLKEKIKSGEVGDDELLSLISNFNKHTHLNRRGGFLKNILNGFLQGYTAPLMWRFFIQSFLIIAIIVAAIILSCNGKLDSIVTAVLLAFVLGFLFGKIK